MGHNGSPYDYVIHVALIVYDHVSLITSFQPPLNVQLESHKSKIMWSEIVTHLAGFVWFNVVHSDDTSTRALHNLNHYCIIRVHTHTH